MALEDAELSYSDPMTGRRNGRTMLATVYYVVGHPWPLIIAILIVVGALAWLSARRL